MALHVHDWSKSTHCGCLDEAMAELHAEKIRLELLLASAESFEFGEYSVWNLSEDKWRLRRFCTDNSGPRHRNLVNPNAPLETPFTWSLEEAVAEARRLQAQEEKMEAESYKLWEEVRRIRT